MDTAAFIKKWWSEAHLDYRHELREWMQNSYSSPLLFWEDLFAYSHPTTTQTVLFEKYDFYTDCIGCHLGKNLTALKVMSEKWTYDQIHAMVDIQIACWPTLEKGKTVTLVLPYGIHFIVSLMTALRLGYIVSILPLNDRFFSETERSRALEALKPDLVIALPQSQIQSRWNILEIDISLEKTSVSSDESHAYLAGDPVQKYFNPHENTLSLIEVTRSYLLPLRDGQLGLNLEPGICWARPMTSVYLEEPYCTLMALLAGATIVHISNDRLISDPKALQDEAIDVLGVSYPLQQLWIKTPGAPSKLKQWYTSPLFGNSRAWIAFSELNKLQKVPMFQVVMEREKGGITLFSQPKPVETMPFLHPSLGSPWKLEKIGEKSGPASEGFGLFYVEPVSENEHLLVIAQIGDEWTISTTTDARREGYPYPITLIEEKVKTLGFVKTCMVVSERHPQHLISQQLVLLVFISPKEHHLIQQKMEEWKNQINHLIQMEVGEAFIPDITLFYSMIPKIEKGQLNRIWVENHYRSGTLFQKQNRMIYNYLNLFKEALYEKQGTV